MIKSATAELIYKTQVICGEGPVWDEVEQKLYWIDIENDHVYLFNPENGANTGWNVGKMIGALTLREKGGLLMVLSNGFNSFDPETGEITPVINPEKELSEHYFNDGKCDPKGRFWAGTYHQNAEDAVGSLYSLETDLSVVKRDKNFILANGLAWSIDKTKFYFIDSVAKCIYVYDYDVLTGNITNRNILRQIEGDIQLPDGMTIDSEGFLWVAIFNGGKVLRIDPVTGKTVFEILIPNAKQVTSCTFGGKNMDELYITTAKILEGPDRIPENELAAQTNAGGLFKIKLNYKGVIATRFKG